MEHTEPPRGGSGLASARLQHREPTPKDAAGATDVAAQPVFCQERDGRMKEGVLIWVATIR